MPFIRHVNQLLLERESGELLPCGVWEAVALNWVGNFQRKRNFQQHLCELEKCHFANVPSCQAIMLFNASLLTAYLCRLWRRSCQSHLKTGDTNFPKYLWQRTGGFLQVGGNFQHFQLPKAPDKIPLECFSWASWLGLGICHKCLLEFNYIITYFDIWKAPS